MHYIELQNVSKKFGNNVVLDDFSMSIKKGESRVLLGGSGTGKSVAIKCIIGLLKPDSGTITLHDLPARESNVRIGMLFQNAALFDSMTVFENVSFPMLNGGQNKGHHTFAEISDLTYKTLEEVGLVKETGALYPSDLSGGMKKRVGLARALMTEPDILFFDEPTTGLDPIMSNVINVLIRDTVKKKNVTALTITHDINSAQHIADTVTMLYEGKNVWTDNISKLMNSKNPLVNQFVHGRIKGPYKI